MAPGDAPRLEVAGPRHDAAHAPGARRRRRWDPRRWRVPLGFLLAAIFVVRARPTWTSFEIGMPIAAVGIAIRAAAAGHIRKNDVLATTGPYRFTRNPLYFGSALLAAGFVIGALDWLLAVLVLLMLAGIYFPVMRSEERFLAERFGAEFESYRARVPKFVPGSRVGPGGSGAFSTSLYRKHREYNALIGFAALVVVLLLKLLYPGFLRLHI